MTFRSFPKRSNKYGAKRSKCLRQPPHNHASALERIMAKVKKTAHCWTWKGANNGNGYGTTVLSGRFMKAHRAVYTLIVGEIPPGLDLDHLCRNRICVNPAHLEPVTRAENLRRSPTACLAGGLALAAKKKARTHCINGHEWNEKNTHLTKTGGWRCCRECARIRANKRYQRKTRDA